MPTVSIVMPVHNSSDFLADSISSVLRQSYGDWELLVVDDWSVDTSLAICHQFLETDRRIRLFKLERSCGPAVARNTAIENAKGRYLAFLDADDCWLPEKLEKQIAFMRETSAAFTYTAYEKIDAEGVVTGKVSVPDSVDYARMLRGNVIGCLTAIYDTKYFGKVYMPEIRKRQDLGLWLKLLKMRNRAYAIQEILAQYRVHGNSLSANKISAAHYTWKLYREVERLSLIKCSWYFSQYAVRGLFNKYK